MSSYKNPAIIPLFQSHAALVKNLWKPPKSTEFSSLLGAPPQYLFALILISVYVFIFSLLLLIIYKKVKESPLSNWLKSTLHKSILYNLKVETSLKGYCFSTLTPQVLRLFSTT